MLYPGMTPADAIRYTAECFGITEADVERRDRRRHIVEGRFAVYTVLRELGLTLEFIAEACGGYHHTTVIHGLERAETMERADPAYRARLNFARRHLGIFHEVEEAA